MHCISNACQEIGCLYNGIWLQTIYIYIYIYIYIPQKKKTKKEMY